MGGAVGLWTLHAAQCGPCMGLNADLGWIQPGSRLDPAWTQARSSLDLNWIHLRPRLDLPWTLGPAWAQIVQARAMLGSSWILAWDQGGSDSHGRSSDINWSPPPIISREKIRRSGTLTAIQWRTGNGVFVLVLRTTRVWLERAFPCQ